MPKVNGIRPIFAKFWLKDLRYFMGLVDFHWDKSILHHSMKSVAGWELTYEIFCMISIFSHVFH